MVCKFHHALTDGVGGVQIAMTLFDLSELPQEHPTLPLEPRSVGRTLALSGYREAARYEAGLVGSMLAAAARAAPALMLNGVRRPVETFGSATATAASVYRTVRPVNRPGSPMMVQRNLIRRVGVHQVPMPKLREAAHRCGGALNDAFLAGVTGGLRRYHDKHGVAVGDLHVTMPISLRTETDEMGGNRITLMIAGALNLMPRWYIGSILRHVDFVASDVPGIPVPVYLGGVAVRMQYAFGPTIGSAVNVTLLTYVDTCALGIDVDTGAVPDYEVFHECLVAGFDEVLALAA